MSLEIARCKTEPKENTVEVNSVSSTANKEDVVAVDASCEEKGEYGNTKRSLKSRHIQLIALGGCIGTGLFVGTGSTLSLVGPAPLFMCIDIQPRQVFIQFADSEKRSSSFPPSSGLSCKVWQK